MKSYLFDIFENISAGMWWLIMIICNPIWELQFEQVHGRLSLIVDQIRCQR